MSLTMKLYHLREVLEQTEECKRYVKAKDNALNDEDLQILFSEFNSHNEMSNRFASYNKQFNQKRLQQLKIQIFANENYQKYKIAEKELNQLRYSIAKELFSVIDEKMYSGDVFLSEGVKKCGL